MFSQIKWRLVFAVTASLLMILVTALEWSIVDRITPFLYGPLTALVWVVFLAAGVAALTCLFQFTEIGVRSLVPLTVVALAFLIVTSVPFTGLWLKADYWLYKSTRKDIVQKVLSGELQPNVSHNPHLIALPKADPLVSMGGNEIVVEEHDAGKYVFFYTYRGILDNYAGFLYVPRGGAPSRFSDLNEAGSTHIEHLEESWYWATHR